MTAESIVKIIQLILAPAVMVTTCAILLGGMQGHYAAVNDRLRAMARERLDLLLGLGQSSNPEAFVSERLEQIDHQLPDILRRHKRIRDTVLLVNCAVLVYLLSMVVIAAAVMTASAWLSSRVFRAVNWASTLSSSVRVAAVSSAFIDHRLDSATEVSSVRTCATARATRCG